MTTGAVERQQVNAPEGLAVGGHRPPSLSLMTDFSLGVQILVAWDHQWVAAHSAQREREDGCYRPNDLCWWALYQCSCLTSTTCVSIRVWSFRVMQPYVIYSPWQTAQLSGRILVRTCRWFLPHCQPVSSISSCPEAGPARHEEP